jgi:hypothetical protein
MQVFATIVAIFLACRALMLRPWPVMAAPVARLK